MDVVFDEEPVVVVVQGTGEPLRLLDELFQAPAYLNVIEPWWKTLRSLALAGRFFETWEQVEETIEKAEGYWNEHGHPYVWGKRKRHRAAKRSGLAAMPQMAVQPG